MSLKRRTNCRRTAKLAGPTNKHFDGHLLLRKDSCGRTLWMTGTEKVMSEFKTNADEVSGRSNCSPASATGIYMLSRLDCRVCCSPNRLPGLIGQIVVDSGSSPHTVGEPQAWRAYLGLPPSSCDRYRVLLLAIPAAARQPDIGNAQALFGCLPSQLHFRRVYL